MKKDKIYPRGFLSSGRTKKSKAAKRKAKKRFFLGITTTLISIVVLILSFFMFIFYSPWTTQYRDQYILMTYMTSNPWLCTTFFSQKTIDRVFQENTIVTPDEELDASLITLNPAPSDESESDKSDDKEPVVEKPKVEFKTSDTYPGEIIHDDGEVQIVKFSGKTRSGKYTARLIQVKDPSRVTLGVTNKLGRRGQLITEFCETNDALCAINAGGFVDTNGKGSGGTPLGTVIKDGVYTQYNRQSNHSIIGFDQNNVLVIGKFTEEECMDLGIRDAMSWRPPSILVLNGEIVEQRGLAGGYDPRSGIGQCADGMVLLLVVDGSSLRGVDGANFALMADIFHSYGAVNAANLDGGTSSSMALEGKVINTVCNPSIAKRGRYLATAWMVKNLPEEEASDF